MIRITSKRAGFRRAGIAHPAEPTDYPDDRFSKGQLAALEAEPTLVVARIAKTVAKVAKTAAGKAKTAGKTASKAPAKVASKAKTAVKTAAKAPAKKEL